MPNVFAEASVFVLPSRKEPWGVVVHEAATTGLPIICSDACGAAVHLIHDGYNGFVFESGNVSDLARCLLTISQLDEHKRKVMSRRSWELSKQYTPDRWAETLIQGVDRL